MSAGGKREGAGRKGGIPNKATLEFKEAINNLIDSATPHMIEWLERVAKDDPYKALDLVHKMSQFCHPLLARNTFSGDKDNPIQHQFTVRSIIDDIRREGTPGTQSTTEESGVEA